VAAAAGNFSADRIRSLTADLMAGAIVAALNIALAVSFAAVLFQGELRGGFAIGLWALLLSMVVTGVVVNLMTSLPPISAGPDTPVVAVLTLLAASVASQVLASGAGTASAVKHALLALSLMTLLAGAVMFLIGALRWGRLLRFVPYPVVGGFLAATGWLLIVSNYKVITGEPLSIANASGALSPQVLPKIGFAVAFAWALLVLRNRIKAAYFMPVAFFGAAAALDLALLIFAPDDHGWFIGGIENREAWLPIAAAASADIDWSILLRALPDIATCIIVGIVSLIVKVSSIETSRSASADFDREFRANGAANLIAAPLGAVAGMVLVSSSKAFIDAGARTRLSGIATAAIVALVVLAGLDLPRFVPTPVLAGFVLLLGYTMLTDALKGAIRQKAWLEFALAAAIAFICVRFGYIAGVVAGFVCSCMLFAFSYGRIGVVRRHLTRAAFSGDVERAPDAERLLRQEGDAIQIYWLSGYIFFGSSEGLYEQVRSSIDSDAVKPVRHVILDFTGVTGIDSSAIVSLVKLGSFCDRRGVILAYSGLTASLEAAFERAGLFGKGKRHRAFPSRNEALDWCEEQLLAAVRPAPGDSAVPDFKQWLARELGGQAETDHLMTYLERNEYKQGDIIYRQGDPSDTINFIAAGTLAISRDDGKGAPRRIRRSAQQTVLGEMGYFRGTRRAATIRAEGPALIYTLSRPSLEQMQRERPDLYESVLRFVIRILSDRLELAHKEVAALI
jgi:SulP family sulfate permease